MNQGQIADNLYGGGIYNNSGALILNNVTFSGNVANAGGGIGAVEYGAQLLRLYLPLILR